MQFGHGYDEEEVEGGRSPQTSGSAPEALGKEIR